MLLNEIKDFSNYLFKTGNLVKLINSEIYAVINDNIYKFKVDYIHLYVINSELKIYLSCFPIAHHLFGIYSDDVEFDYDELNNKWFYTMEHARNSKRKKLSERQLTLF
jgi:hypothetical protein